jgi:predicted ATP-binding protein involved in virulence
MNEFPYISQLIVNNCYTYKDFKIPNEELKEFKHIILTGKNGSGKTTILNRINFLIKHLQAGKTREQGINNLKGIIQANQTHGSRPGWEKEIEEYDDLILAYLNGGEEFLIKEQNNYIFSHFRAHRKVELKTVSTVTKEDEFITALTKQNTSDDFISQFKQYLVNKKVYEAFDFMNSKNESINQSKRFFENLADTLRVIFKDQDLILEFVQESFEFYLQLSDKRRITFNQLSEGFSAFLSIIMDLMMRVDLMRKSAQNFQLDPAGIVLIDEPETHFHLSMQYEILPLISSLFPKVQLIIATHSPAIISSVKNAVVYDLTSKKEVADWLLGSSFSELMIQHFGLENEFSPVADKILAEINEAVRKKDSQALTNIISENEKYLTPALRLEIESQIIKIKNSLK